MENKSKKTDSKKPTLRGEKTKHFFLCMFGFLASTLPLAALLCMKWEEYTAEPGSGIKLCFGAVAIVILLALKVLGKLKLPSRVTVMAISLVIVYLLEALLADLTLILFVATIGEAVDAFLFAPFAKRCRARIDRMKQADATADRVEELLKQYTKG